MRKKTIIFIALGAAVGGYIGWRKQEALLDRIINLLPEDQNDQYPTPTPLPRPGTQEWQQLAEENAKRTDQFSATLSEKTLREDPAVLAARRSLHKHPATGYSAVPPNC